MGRPPRKSRRRPPRQPFRNFGPSASKNGAPARSYRVFRGSAIFPRSVRAVGRAVKRSGETPPLTGRAPSTGDRRRRGPPGARASARVDRPRRTETESERADKRDRRDGPVAAAMQIPQPIEPLDGQGENRQQPPDQQAVRVVVTDVLHAVAGLALVEPLVLDLPAALGKAVEQPAREVIRVPELDLLAALLHGQTGRLGREAGGGGGQH